MKRSLLIFYIIITSLHTNACDICGCGAGSTYIGIMPGFHKHIVGLRYRYNTLQTHLGAGGSNTYLTTQEKYTIMELWSGWKITDNFSVMLTLPYSFNEKINQGISKNKNGISDISFAAYYKLLDKSSAVLKNKLFTQSLWIGGGIKLPTGKYNPADKSSNNQNTNLFQLGTGSVDFSIAAMYDARLQNAGINISAICKMNNSNKYDYVYGNKLNLTAQAYYQVQTGNITLSPNAGVQYETAQKDIDNHFNVDLSGGNVWLGTFGLETVYKKIAVGANWQIPISQNLAGGFVKGNNRLMVHLAFAL